MPKKSVQVASKNTVLWENEFDEGYEYLEAAGLRLVLNLINNVEPRSKLGFMIANFFEKDRGAYEGIAGHLTEEMKQYRKAIEEHAVRKAELEDKKEELEAEIQEKEEEITALGSPFRLSPRSFKKKELAAQVDTLYQKMQHLQREQENLTHPQYTAVYSSGEEDIKKLSGARPKDWKRLKRNLEKGLKAISGKQDNTLFDNLNMFCEELRFSDVEKRLAAFMLCYQQVYDFKTFVDVLSGDKEANYTALVARMINADKEEVARALLPSAALASSGILVDPDTLEGYEHDFYDAFGWYVLDKDLIKSLEKNNVEFHDIVKEIIGEVTLSNRSWTEDFLYLGERDVRQIADLVKGSVGSRHIKGSNIIFHGDPGLGKTEGAKALCAEQGIALYAISRKNEDGSEPSRTERIRKLMIAQSLLKRVNGKAAILVDGAEDLLDVSGLQEKGYSIEFVNDLLENNEVLTIWTANSVAGIHPAARSRMRGVEFSIPPYRNRLKIVKDLNTELDVQLSEHSINEIASHFEAPIRLIKEALKEVKRVEEVQPEKTRMSEEEKIRIFTTSIRGIAKLAFGSASVVEAGYKLSKNYDVALQNLKTIKDKNDTEGKPFNIEELISEVEKDGRTDFRMLLFGPPGTGKTDTAHYIADSLHMGLIVKRASDILDKYVGGTEKNIRAAFMEAEEKNSVLVIDEIDSLLSSREKAEKSWEVTQVNEILTCLQHAKIPVVFTTNFKKNLDAAAFRRFDFKIMCDYLNPEQAARAFKNYFEVEPPETLARLEHLASGDFANVKRQLRYATKLTPEEIVERLAAESADRAGNRRPIGVNIENVQHIRTMP